MRIHEEIWERIHKDLLCERICKDLQDFGRGFARLWDRISEDLGGFVRLWERIHKDL